MCTGSLSHEMMGGGGGDLKRAGKHDAIVSCINVKRWNQPRVERNPFFKKCTDFFQNPLQVQPRHESKNP